MYGSVNKQAGFKCITVAGGLCGPLVAPANTHVHLMRLTE